MLFETALRLARNRKLLGDEEEERRRRRRDFAGEIRNAIRRIDAIEALATSRPLGLID